jgi:hypothetical protein
MELFVFKKLLNEYEDLSYKSSITILIIFVLVTYLPLFYNIYNLGIQDFDYNFFTLNVGMDAFTKHKEMPLFNFFDQGGLPLLATPFSRSLSPFNIIYFFLDYIIALKMELILHLLIAACGMFFFLKSYKFRNDASLIGSLLFSLNSFHSLTIAQGQYELLSAVFIPWLFFTLRERKLLSFSVIWSIVFLEGGVYILAISLLALAIYTLLNKKKMVILNSALFIMTGLFVSSALTAIKLVPSLVYMKNHPRLIDDFSGFSFSSAFHSLVNKQQFITDTTDVTITQNFMNKMKFITDDNSLITGMDYGWDENGMFIGWIFFFILIISLIRYFYQKKYMRELCIFFIFSLIAMGDRLTPSLWRGLKFFAPFESMRHATRFRVILVLFMAMFISALIHEFLIKNKEKHQKSLTITFLLLTVAVSMSVVNFNVLKTAFNIKPLTNLTQQNFHFEKSWLKNKVYNKSTAAGFYPAYKENIGLTFSKENHAHDINAIPISEPSYQGEIVDESTIVYNYKRTNNTLKFNAIKNHTYQVNMNYFEDWECENNCNITERNGRLEVSANETGEILLRYNPLSFKIGWIISLLSVLFISALKLKDSSLDKLFKKNIDIFLKKIS